MAESVQILKSRQMLKRVRGGRDGLYPFLENTTWDIVQFHDDFLGDEMQGSGSAPGLYEVATTTDGDFLMVANGINGLAKLRTGTSAVDNAGAGLSLPELSCTGQQNPVFACRFESEFHATTKIEMGWTDVTTDVGAVNTTATPTTTADDVAVFVQDSDDTTGTPDDGLQWQQITNAAAGTAVATLTGVTPVLAVYQTLIVGLRDGDAIFAILNSNGMLVYGPVVQASAVTATDPMVPWLFVANRDGTNLNNLDIDFINVRWRRTIA